MLTIELVEDGLVAISGRFDAAQADKADEILSTMTGEFEIDCSALEYVSSAGLGVLLKTHKRLLGEGSGLRIRNVTPHIANIFKYSGFDKLFDIDS